MAWHGSKALVFQLAGRSPGGQCQRRVPWLAPSVGAVSDF